MKNVIIGKFNNISEVYYWQCDKGCNIGDYAIVENRNGFDLVKIVGIGALDSSLRLATKKVVKVIPKNELVNVDVPF